MLRAIVGGVVGGVLGAAGWAALAYYASFHHTSTAIAIGGLVGFCAAKASGGVSGAKVGLIAAIIALAAVLGGKYAAVRLSVHNRLVAPGSAIPVTDPMLKMMIADGVAGEFESAGRALAWPPGMSVGVADKPQDYPPEVWTEAVRRWDAMTPMAQEAMRDQKRAAIKALVEDVGKDVVWQKFKQSFKTMDVLMIAAAVIGAFAVATVSR
jgi:hypothetical protein